jgi:hypothetical protein
MKDSKIKTMQVIHAAMCMAVFTFLLVACYLNYEKTGAVFGTSFKGSTDSFLPPAFAVIMAGLGVMLFKKQIEKIGPEATFDSKITAYQTAMLVRIACLEAAALFNVVTFFLNGHYLYALAAVLLLVAMLMTRPTKEKVVATLNLSYPDTDKL